ncbi:MAG: PLDc N-terminal domain-containing protein [Gammaproteobacteria bacterium]|nr:PLDc N-terminal domain-containing protein [Gammaproteobacteria bacterium]MBQ0775693.1 PLDc N-terminal domain-containing protein [Gammaproteobacteria bacterium]
MDWKQTAEQGIEQLLIYWPAIAAITTVTLSSLTTLHLVFHKRDPRAAAAWAGLVWLVPVVGVVLYLLLGINRIRRRARQLTGGERYAITGWRAAAEPAPQSVNLHSLSQMVGVVTGLPLTGGNAMSVIDSADALSKMVQAIERAKESIYLMTYIFGNDNAGKAVVDALREAAVRGVRIRVLVDGVGSLYSIPTVVGSLRRAGVPVARFLYSLAPWRMPYLNLRNHRKLLIIDQTEGFTGGMNIRAGYLGASPTTRDIHFHIAGPVVGQLLRSFVADWQFSTAEVLDHSYRGAAVCGDVMARGISTGPDADFEKRRLILLAAIGRAERQIRIVTPYFVPDQGILTALNIACLRGVHVQVVLPERNNLRTVQWASMHMLRWMIADGLDVRMSIPPFDHSKMMTIDGAWAMVGSGNWDARSFRLNFEFDLECYGEGFATQLDEQIDRRIALAQRLDRAAFERLPVWKKIRNALAYLLEPYL